MPNARTAPNAIAPIPDAFGRPAPSIAPDTKFFAVDASQLKTPRMTIATMRFGMNASTLETTPLTAVGPTAFAARRRKTSRTYHFTRPAATPAGSAPQFARLGKPGEPAL